MKIKDNSENDAESFAEIEQLTIQIKNKTLGQLEKEGIFVFPPSLENSEDIDVDKMVLSEKNCKYLTTNIMGFIGYGNERLSIISRFSQTNEDYFFQYLLSQVLDIPNIIEQENDIIRKDKSYLYLLFLFPHYLKSALRKGAYKSYVWNRYNDGNIRGTIDISEHIHKNTPFLGKVAYRQREFSYDNWMTELVRHTLEYIKAKPYGAQLLQSVHSEVQQVTDATSKYEHVQRSKIIILNKQNPIRHAYYREYRTLQRVCLSILGEEQHQLGDGNENVHGLLFDGAWLWEEYINSLIKEIFHHPKNKDGKGAQQLFKTDSGVAGRIYPDFISHDRGQRIIADAKYKPSKNIKNKDYLQILAYMYRFDSEKGYYLYPEKESLGKQKYKLNTGTTYDKNVSPGPVEVYKLGLCIPKDVKNYEEFVEKIAEEEKNFKKIIAS